MEAPVTVDAISPRLRFPANPGPASPDLVTPAIQTKTDYPPKQSACQTCQFFPESSLLVFRVVRPEVERHLIWPITPPCPHHPRRSSWTAGMWLTLSLCSFTDFSAGRAQRIHSAGGLSFEPFPETLLVIVLMLLHIRANVSSLCYYYYLLVCTRHWP